MYLFNTKNNKITVVYNVESQCKSGRTPLHYAALYGRCSRAQTLLQNGNGTYTCDFALFVPVLFYIFVKA